MKSLLQLLLFLVLVTVAGCQGGNDKPAYANVSGTVTFNGQPIEKGKITFSADGRPPSTMDIADGKFTGQAMVGSNKISVSAKRKVATAPKLSKGAETQIKGYSEKMKGEFGGPPADYDPTMVEYIPPEWGQASTQVRVIEANAPNEFKLEIKGK